MTGQPDPGALADDGAHRPTAGELIRRWRFVRGFSTLDLAARTDISLHDLDRLESDRLEPTPELLLRIADRLEVPLRGRNEVLTAAGHEPAYPETPLDAVNMAVVRATVRDVLNSDGYPPAVAVDGRWNLLAANDGAALLTEGVAPELLVPPINLLRMCLHPNGMAPNIVNLAEWHGYLLGMLRRQLCVSPAPGLTELYQELCGYHLGSVGPSDSADTVVPLRIIRAGRQLVLVNAVTVFTMPLDVTVNELSIQSFFPADVATAELLAGS
jgi:transcriptional regulator with XRE-family HTH domain